MGSFHYRGLSVREVEDWVFVAVADGASRVFTYVVEEIGHTEGVEKVDTLIRASREVERMLGRDATRAQIGEQVSDAGKNRFWSHWPE